MIGVGRGKYESTEIESWIIAIICRVSQYNGLVFNDWDYIFCRNKLCRIKSGRCFDILDCSIGHFHTAYPVYDHFHHQKDQKRYIIKSSAIQKAEDFPDSFFSGQIFDYKPGKVAIRYINGYKILNK
jgi:hypothetical protein